MMYKDIPLPRLLPEANKWEERRIKPEKVSINLNITPLSYATMELPQDESVPERSYVELFTCMGSAGIYRVRSPHDAYGDDVTTVELEHAIVEVGDYLVKNTYDEMMSATTAMTTVFGHYNGSKWALGDISALGNGQIALEANYNRVLEAMLAIMDQKPDLMMTFDFSTSPRWTINIVQRDINVSAEGRLSRNVNFAKISYDDTELCTRAYYEREATTDEAQAFFPNFDPAKLYGKKEYVNYNGKLYQLPEGHNPGVTWANTTKEAVTDYPTSIWEYVDADTISTYGLIERSVQTGSNFTASEALQVATEYINKHKKPRISVEVSLEELSSTTGESLDTFAIGKLCRLALADYNTTVEKHITGMSFPDVYEQPTNITANLAEEEDAVINFIHDIDAKGGSGGGGGGGKKKDDTFKAYRTDINKDDYHAWMTSEHVNEAGQILQAAGIDVDSRTGVVIYHEDRENSVGGRITVESNRIGLVVSGTGANASIKAAEIWTSIDTTLRQSHAVISADIIDLNGIVSYLTAKDIEVGGLTVDGSIDAEDINCEQIDCTGIGTNTGNVNCGGTVSTAALEVDGSSASWKSQTVITSIGVSTKSLEYKNHSGSNATQTVVISVGKNSTTLNYLG